MLSLIERIMAIKARINIVKTFAPGDLTNDPVDDVTVVHIGAQGALTSATLVVMNGVIFDLAVNYTVPSSRVANIVRLEVNGVAVVADMDAQIDIYDASTSVKSIGVAQNVTNFIQDYPICRQFVATEAIGFYGKGLDAAIEKTFNVEAWILVTKV